MFVKWNGDLSVKTRTLIVKNINIKSFFNTSNVKEQFNWTQKRELRLWQKYLVEAVIGVG